MNAHGSTVIFVTHHMWVVAEYADRVFIVKDGQILLDGRHARGLRAGGGAARGLSAAAAVGQPLESPGEDDAIRRRIRPLYQRSRPTRRKPNGL